MEEMKPTGKSQKTWNWTNYVHQVLPSPPPPEDHWLQKTLPEFFKVILWLLYLYL